MSRSAPKNRRSRGGGARALDAGSGLPAVPAAAVSAEGLAAQLSSAYGNEVTPDEAREIARNVNEFLSVLEGWTKQREPVKEVDQ